MTAVDEETLHRWIGDASREAFDVEKRRCLNEDEFVVWALTFRELRKPNPYRAYLGWRRIA